MTEKDWFKIDRANGRFESAWAELRAAYVEQIKRLEKAHNETVSKCHELEVQLINAHQVINSAKILYKLCVKNDYSVAHTGVFKGDYDFLESYLERYGKATDQLIAECLNERGEK